MSIIETKFRKGFVETPELRTDNIEYLGIDYPMYDVVNKTFVPNPTQYEEEFSNSSSFQEKEFEVIRILPHTPVFENVGLITLKGISLHAAQREGELEYIVLCVFGKRGQSYEYLGHSTNIFINPTRETFIDFDFDLKLFTDINGVQMPYREIYLRPLIVQLNENGSFVVKDELKNWDNLDDRTRLKLKACGNTNANFNPYITNLDGTDSPHVIFKYTTGSYTTNDKIAHILNGDVHLNSKDRETIEELHELGNRVFNEDDFVIHDTVIDTRELNSAYHSRGSEIMCAFTVDPKDFVGQFITELRFRRGESNYKMQNKYLQADCYDINNRLVGTHWSIEPKSQVSEDNGETIFNFADFIVREEYNSIEFKISTSNTTRQENYLSFCGSSLRNSSNRGYCAKDGWILKWLNGAPESGTNPSTQNNLTPDFSIVFSKGVTIKGTGMIKHVTNTNIHVTAEDKERWDNLEVELNAGSCIEIGENNTISVKTADTLSFDEKTVPTTKTMYLEMGYVLTDAQTYADEAVSGHRNQSGLHTSTLLQNKWNGHVDDDTIHVTANEKTEWNGHVGTDDIHVTAEEKAKWNSIVVPEIPEIPEQIVYTEGNNIAISDDNVISVITTDVIDESDKIPTSKAVHEIFYETHQFNNFDSSKYTYLPDTVGTIVLSKKHFISGGKITKVTIPHGNTQEDLTNGQGGFLVIDVFKEDNSYPEGYNINSPTHRFWADEYYAYKNRLNEGHYEWTFNERDCIIPDDYKVVHLSLVVDEANVSKVGVTSSSNAQFRINCLAKNGDRDEGVVFEEDDECKLYWNGSTNGANRVAIVEVEYEAKTIDVSKITELNTTLETHISSDVHLSSSDKTNISKVSQLETSLNNHIGDDTHVTSAEKTKWNEHVNDTDIHVTTEEKDTLSRLAKEDLISEVENKIDLVRTTLDEHIGDFEEHVYKYGLHLSDTEKNISRVDTKVNEEVTNLQTKVNEAIDTLTLFTKFGQFERFSSLDNPNYGVHTDGKMNATAFDLSREHFTTGDIKTVEIHHIDGDDVKNIILCAVIFKAGEHNNTPKTLDDCIYSTNTQNQIDGNYSGKLIFQFDNLILPDDYEFVRFFFAKNKTAYPANNNADTVHSVRVQVLRNINANSWDEYNDDECKIYTTSNSANWYIGISCSRIYYPYSDIKTIFERINSLEARVNELEKS